MKEKASLCLWLWGVNLFISTFTFGGGYVVVPMVRKYYVEKRHLFVEEELMEMAAVAQSSPGAIAVNLVGLAGYRAAGVTGAVVSCMGAVLPPLAILSVVSLCYSALMENALVAAVLRGMQAGAAALIVDFVADMAALLLKKRSLMLDGLIVASFALSFFTRLPVALILIGSCLACLGPLWLKREEA